MYYNLKLANKITQKNIKNTLLNSFFVKKETVREINTYLSLKDNDNNT